MDATTDPATPDDERWNHNIHQHGVILHAVPAGARNALDVGCGEGMLARQLRRLVPRVVGVDPHEPSIALARERSPTDVEFRVGDVLTEPFEPASFDVIASVATLHHLDAAVALARLRELLRPGGVLAIVGCARSRLPADLPFELASVVLHRVHRRGRTLWQHPSPVVWPPPETYASMRAIAAAVLPGADVRRRPPWRYSLVWTAPPR